MQCLYPLEATDIIVPYGSGRLPTGLGAIADGIVSRSLAQSRRSATDNALRGCTLRI